MFVAFLLIIFELMLVLPSMNSLLSTAKVRPLHICTSGL